MRRRFLRGITELLGELGELSFLCERLELADLLLRDRCGPFRILEWKRLLPSWAARILRVEPSDAQPVVAAQPAPQAA